jgi:hypothetical protein
MNKNRVLKAFAMFIAIAMVSFAAINTGFDEVPNVYHNIFSSEKGNYFVDKDGNKNYENHKKAKWRFTDFEEIEYGNPDGILLKFKKDFEGTVIYGLYPDEKMEHPHAVFFKKPIAIVDGKALLKIRPTLAGKYDLANWEKNKHGVLRYRVFDDKNNIITNKRIVFSVNEKGFVVEPGITAGPFITSLSENGLTMTFWTNTTVKAKLIINNKEYFSDNSKKHVYHISGLEPSVDYKYEINLGVDKLFSHIKTAPKTDVNSDFTFAFASDSRGGTQLGESQANGHNAYIMRKMAALATYKNVDFFQFTGDMINGYKSDIEQMRFEYMNWLKTMSPYFHSTAFNVGMGNHEAFLKVYGDEKKYYSVDNFPFDEQSAESVFSEFFENGNNGPKSEDGAKYDLDKKNTNFPEYKKTVYSYTYGNLAMIVMNSNYWYTPSEKLIPQIGGNVHGYIMDKQLEWLNDQLSKYESDKNIEHIFVTIHTPAFPNGGHAHNDMWYNGNNDIRPYVGGKAVEKGIIERRDEFLDLLVNKSKKFRVLLTGDEHNYTRLTINENSKIYPDNWKGKRIKLSRPFVQIVDGAAGAPYYAEEKMPWSSDLNIFSAQFALVIFHVQGNKIFIKVMNPDTLELIEEYQLN